VTVWGSVCRSRGLYIAKGRSLVLDLTPWITQPTCLGGQADCKARGKESRGPAEAAFIIYSAKGCFCVSYLKRIFFGGAGGGGVCLGVWGGWGFLYCRSACTNSVFMLSLSRPSCYVVWNVIRQLLECISTHRPHGVKEGELWAWAFSRDKQLLCFLPAGRSSVGTYIS
jgi:hypothetical protein